MTDSVQSKPNLGHPALDEGLCIREPAAAVRRLVAERREWFHARRAFCCDPIEINRASSDAIDAVVLRLCSLAGCRLREGRVSVLALGGYGRREMAPQSDVDLLFLTEEERQEEAAAVTDAVLYPLWDGGLKAGGATRTVEGCARIMHEDLRALTAMLDARLVAGSPALFGRLRAAVSSHFDDPANRRLFVEGKIEERAARLARFAGAMYLAQPNVKEGEGGLRDFQTLLWLASVAVPGSDFLSAARGLAGGRSGLEALERSYRFLWSVRHALHLAPGGHGDRLSVSLQSHVAGKLGFLDSGCASAAEELMTEYHRRAEPLHLACARALQSVRLRSSPPSRLVAFFRRGRVSGDVVRSAHRTLELRGASSVAEPAEVLRLFAASRRTGLPVGPETKGALASNLIWRSRGPGEREVPLLRQIFSGLENLGRVLGDMHECGALEWAFPEMGRVYHRAPSSGTHAHPVGEHSIRTVNLAARLMAERESPFAAAAAGIRRVHVLALAAFLHDVGKGGGEDHEERGAGIAGEIAARLGFEGRDCGDVEFLVRSHLLMSRLAFRRDIRDPALIERFARSSGSTELLSMLYVITCADIMAVGPNVWSGWKGSLLAELYARTREHMAAGGLSPARRAREAERLTREAVRFLGSACDGEALRDFLLSLPERYIFSVAPESVAAHFMMSRDVTPDSPATLTRRIPERGCTELSVVAADSPGLFAKIAGVLSANGANIVEARLYTSGDGTAIDLLWVTDALHRPYDDERGWAKIRRELAAAVSGERDLESIVGGRFKRRLMGWSAGKRPVEVTVDNDVSASHTVVEISADDRRGLLYTIADALHNMGLSIDVARISTHVDRVTDVFYIRESADGKIAGRGRIEEMRLALAQALAD